MGQHSSEKIPEDQGSISRLPLTGLSILEGSRCSAWELNTKCRMVPPRDFGSTCGLPEHPERPLPGSVCHHSGAGDLHCKGPPTGFMVYPIPPCPWESRTERMELPRSCMRFQRPTFQQTKIASDGRWNLQGGSQFDHCNRSYAKVHRRNTLDTYGE